MNKKKTTILALLMVAVMILSLSLLVACNNDTLSSETTVDEIKATEGLLISNGDFKGVTSGSKVYPRTLTDWTGAKMYSSGSFPDDVVAGAVSLESALYNEFKSKWNDKGAAIKDDKSMYDILSEKFSADKDAVNNALMIYMPKKGTDLDRKDDEYGPTAYGYTSKNFTLAKSSYYKFSVDVLTFDIDGTKDKDGNLNNEPGARIYLSSNTYAEFDKIDTKGEWKTYEVYLESNAISSTTLTVQLGLGKYSSTYTKGLTSGYAFFDNLSLEKIEKVDDGKIPEQIFDEAKDAETLNNTYIQTTTLKVPNGRFDFGSTTISSSSAPSNWSAVTGNSSLSDPAPSSLGSNGIIDASKDAFDKNYAGYAGTYYINASKDKTTPADKLSESDVSDIISTKKGLGNNVFMLSQQLMTAQGAKSAKTVTFEKGKTYALSISIYTFNINGEGVSLVLTGTDGKTITIKGISNNLTKKNTNASGGVDSPLFDGGNANGGWTTYTFYVTGNQYKDYSYNMTLWLGTGGTSDNSALKYTKYTSTSSSPTTNGAVTYDGNGTFSTGWAFFDELTLTENPTVPDSGVHKPSIETEFILDYTKDNTNHYNALQIDLQSRNLFQGTGISFDFTNNTTSADSDSQYDGKTLGTPTGWTSKFDPDKAGAPVIDPRFVNAGSMSLESITDYTAFNISHPGKPYTNSLGGALMMQASKDAYYEMQTNSFAIAPNGFYRISMWVKTVDIKSTSGIYVSLINQNELDDETDDTVLESFAKINTKEFDENTSDWCELTFVVRGHSIDQTNVYLKLAFGTGTRWTSATLASGAAFATNLSMTAITYDNFSNTSAGTYLKTVNLTTSSSSSFTNGAFDNYDLEKTEGLDEEGQLLKNAGLPKNWALSNNALTADEKKNLVAGIIKVDNKTVAGKEDGLYFKSSKQIKNLFGDTIVNKFDSLYGAENNDYLKPETLGRLGGPNMLALAGLNNEAYSIGYSSDSFTLSSGRIYKLSVWVKTIGATSTSIFLTGESSGSVEFGGESYFAVKNTHDSEWKEYVFNIEVGLSNVSLKLNMWLGYDKEVFTTDEIAEKSSGIALFDSVTLNQLTEKEFDEIKDDSNGTAKKISFLSDGFDSISSTVASRKELTTPTGWSGSEDTSQDKANTKSGTIFDADLEEIDGEFIKILGKDLKINDIVIPQDELAEAKKSSIYEGKTDDEIIAALKVLKLEKMKLEQWMPIDQLKAYEGNRMLIINNMVDSAYSYSSSNYTMQADAFYLVSVMVRTYGIAEGKDKGAYIELYLGSANEANTPLIFKAVKTSNNTTDTTTEADTKTIKEEWTKYSFYVATNEESISSIKLRLGLGKYYDKDNKDTLTSGYAMFDNVKIEKVTSTQFDTAVLAEKDDQSAEFGKILTRTVPEKPTSGSTEGNGTTETPARKFNLDTLWWMIPTILLGLATIAVVIAFAIKKLRKPKRAGVVVKAEPNSDTIDKKHDDYDSYKE